MTGADLRHVDVWLFDLDNTLYPPETQFMGLIEARMTQFVAQHVGLSHDDAHALQKKYYHENGTTLAGLMANHGVVTWSHNNLEEAYWRMEIIEAYCRTLLVTAQLGKVPNTFTPTQLNDLLKIKQSLGYVDPRYGMKECELCDNAEWRPGVACAIPPNPESAGAGLDPDAEAAVKAITDQILAQMK